MDKQLRFWIIMGILLVLFGCSSNNEVYSETEKSTNYGNITTIHIQNGIIIKKYSNPTTDCYIVESNYGLGVDCLCK